GCCGSRPAPGTSRCAQTSGLSSLLAPSILAERRARKPGAQTCKNVRERWCGMAEERAIRRDSKLVAALTAAQLYYMQDKTMEAIAKELKTSRSTVSRLLSYARTSGLVDIRINSPLERLGMLEQRL